MNLTLDLILKLFNYQSIEEAQEAYKYYLEGGLEIVNELLIRELGGQQIQPQKREEILNEMQRTQEPEKIYEMIYNSVSEKEQRTVKDKIKEVLSKYDEKIINQAIEEREPEELRQLFEELKEENLINYEVVEEIKKGALGSSEGTPQPNNDTIEQTQDTTTQQDNTAEQQVSQTTTQTQTEPPPTEEPKDDQPPINLSSVK